MRSKFTKALVALLTVFALTAVGVAQASAHEFTASVAGTLETKQSGVQVFGVSGGPFECGTATGTAKVVKGSQKTIKETVQYGECIWAFGLMKANPAEYEFSAEGKVTLLKTFTIEVTGIPNCTMTFEPSTGVSVAHYKNVTGGKLATEYGLTFKYKGNNQCAFGPTAAVEGNLLSTLPAGTIEWK